MSQTGESLVTVVVNCEISLASPYWARTRSSLLRSGPVSSLAVGTFIPPPIHLLRRIIAATPQ